MSRRMEIELTSSREAGGFTWRAAGAREPRGVLEPSLAPEGARVGDVLRVEVEADIDGINVLSVLPPREKGQVTGLIEVVGTPKELVPVTTTLAPRHGRPRPGGPGSGDGEGGGPRGGRRDGARTGERDRRDDRRGERPDRGTARRTGAARGPAGARNEGPRGPGERPSGGRGPAREPRPAPAGEGRPPSNRPPRATAEEGQAQGARAATRGRPPRFVPGRAHIDAVLSGLPPEQRPIADQLVAGGLPAVRRALAASRDQARESGGSEPANETAILALAEQMLPSVKEALWLDRAEAAVAALEHISLRDLRATVLGAVPRDEHGRELDRSLREALDQRVTRLRESWHADMTRALEDGRVLQALRLSGRPPEPSARFPAPLVTPLSEAASAAMAADTPAERWAALLEAVEASPVRRYVKPAGLPGGADETLLRAARQAAGRVPALAPLLGMAMPPPPGPAATARPAGPPRAGAGAGGARRHPAPARPRLPREYGHGPAAGAGEAAAEDAGAGAGAGEAPQPAEPEGAASDVAPGEPEAARLEAQAAALEAEAEAVELEAAAAEAVAEAVADQAESEASGSAAEAPERPLAPAAEEPAPAPPAHGAAPASPTASDAGPQQPHGGAPPAPAAPDAAGQQPPGPQESAERASEPASGDAVPVEEVGQTVHQR